MLLVVFLFNLSYAISLDDLAPEDRDTTIAFLEGHLDDLEEMTIEELEGIRYEIYEDGVDYLIVIVDGEYYLVPKE